MCVKFGQKSKSKCRRNKHRFFLFVPHVRPCLAHSLFFIQIYTKLCRAFYGESRANTVVFVRNTINQVVALIKTPTQPALDAQVKASFVIDLKQSIVGLTALSETYTGDVRVCCELAQIIEIVKRNT